MEDEVFAIIYNNKPGVYEATVTFGEKSLTKRFKLEGLNRIFCSIIYLTLFYWIIVGDSDIVVRQDWQESEEISDMVTAGI